MRLESKSLIYFPNGLVAKKQGKGLQHLNRDCKILQARLQQYMNRELPDVQAALGKAEEPEITLPTSNGSSKKQESFR